MMLWLTPMEWRLCYALTFAWGLNGELHPGLSMTEQFRAVIHRLQHVYGYQWEAIRVNDDQQMYLLQSEPVSPDNFNWIAMMQSEIPAMRPSYYENTTAALDYCREHQELRDLCSFLEEVLAKVEIDMIKAKILHKQKLQDDPEYREAIEAEAARKRAVLERLGIIPKEDIN